MNREIIILTKSKKNGKYCVSGIDRNNGEWIRLLSKDAYSHNAIDNWHLCYADGTIVEIYDVVKIDFTSHNPSYYTSEDYFFDETKKWGKIGKSNLSNVISLNNSKPQYIFLNNSNCITEIEARKDLNKKSLVMVNVNDITVIVQKFDGKTKVTVCFYYNNFKYDYLQVTDINFFNNYANKGVGTYNIKNAYFVISLGTMYMQKHYKLISQVL